MLRSSILYASETYYGLSEYQIRQIETIEERFLRKIFKTSRGCPNFTVIPGSMSYSCTISDSEKLIAIPKVYSKTRF